MGLPSAQMCVSRYRARPFLSPVTCYLGRQTVALDLRMLLTARDQASSTLRGAGGALDRLAEKARGVGLAMTAAGGTILTAAGLAVRAAAEQEAAEDRLRKIYGEGADEIIRYAAERQKLTRFGDEETIAAAAVGATYIGLRDNMEEAIAAAQDMSEAYGTDLTQSMHMLGKASAGMVSNLRRVGIMVDANEFEARGMAAVYEELDHEFQQVSVRSESSAKAMQQVKNALGDTAESVGEALLPVIKDLAPAIQSVAETMGQMAESPLGAMLIKVGVGLGGVMAAVGPILYVLPQLQTGLGIVTGLFRGKGLAATEAGARAVVASEEATAALNMEADAARRAGGAYATKGRGAGAGVGAGVGIAQGLGYAVAAYGVYEGTRTTMGLLEVNRVMDEIQEEMREAKRTGNRQAQYAAHRDWLRVQLGLREYGAQHMGLPLDVGGYQAKYRREYREILPEYLYYAQMAGGAPVSAGELKSLAPIQPSELTAKEQRAVQEWMAGHPEKVRRLEVHVTGSPEMMREINRTPEGRRAFEDRMREVGLSAAYAP